MSGRVVVRSASAGLGVPSYWTGSVVENRRRAGGAGRVRQSSGDEITRELVRGFLGREMKFVGGGFATGCVATDIVDLSQLQPLTHRGLVGHHARYQYQERVILRHRIPRGASVTGAVLASDPLTGSERPPALSKKMPQRRHHLRRP